MNMTHAEKPQTDHTRKALSKTITILKQPTPLVSPHIRMSSEKSRANKTCYIVKTSHDAKSVCTNKVVHTAKLVHIDMSSLAAKKFHIATPVHVAKKSHTIQISHPDQSVHNVKFVQTNKTFRIVKLSQVANTSSYPIKTQAPTPTPNIKRSHAGKLPDVPKKRSPEPRKIKKVKVATSISPKLETKLVIGNRNKHYNQKSPRMKKKGSKAQAGCSTSD
ncbi:unnamed protein product [Lactuca saligna]|uniref:Uncharacterized protein n=1 Tax=Lactuca saligna TaxID=75948 RepID=A0AA36E033_LACSI|nr:unnamed protein product [Lactuca saligna]